MDKTHNNNYKEGERTLWLQQLDKHRHNVLAVKQKEYALEDDRFRSFSDGAEKFLELTGRSITREDFLLALLMKHLVSIEDFVCNRKTASKEILFEKFGDALNYIELLKEMTAYKNCNTCTFSLVSLDARLQREFLSLMERISSK